MLVKRPKLRWWERTYFPAILQGLSITFAHLFKKSVTLQYPEERHVLPKRYRGAPVLLTAMPRTRPSVESMEMQRAVFSPRCCETSMTRLSTRASMPGFVTESAV